MRKTVEILLRWWWLILISTIIAAGSSYYSVRRQPPVYEAEASLIVGRTFRDPNPSSNEFYLEQQLASIYASVGSRQIAEPTMKALELNSLPGYIVRPVPNSPLIEIVVTDTNNARAQAVANELARQLVKSSPSGQSGEDNDRQSFIQDQLDKLQNQITETDKDLSDARQLLGELSNARQIEDTQVLIAALEDKLRSLTNTYSSLLSNTDDGATNNLAILQYAPLPQVPVGPNKIRYVLIASAFGMALSLAAIYGIELLEGRVNQGDEIAAFFDTPILGHIPKFPRNGNKVSYIIREPLSPVSDAFHSLRANLDFMGVKYPLQTILISSVDGKEGKSTIAINLALSIARSEKKVVLVEADLRQPALCAAFGLDEKPGISDICVGRIWLENALMYYDMIPALNGKAEKSIDRTVGSELCPSFWFLPSGATAPNPAELLDSTQFDQILESLKKMADVVIIDSTPLFLPDAAVLLSRVDGLLLISRQNKTRTRVLHSVRDQISRSGVRLLGIVVNQSQLRQQYYHYSAYHRTAARSQKRRWKLNLPEFRQPMNTSTPESSQIKKEEQP